MYLHFATVHLWAIQDNKKKKPIYVYWYDACCPLYYFYVSLIYGQYLANVLFVDIPHILSFRTLLFIAQKKIRIEFSATT